MNREYIYKALGIQEILNARFDLVDFARIESIEGANERYLRAKDNYCIANWRKYNNAPKLLMFFESSVYAIGELEKYIQECIIARKDIEK